MQTSRFKFNPSTSAAEVERPATWQTNSIYGPHTYAGYRGPKYPLYTAMQECSIVRTRHVRVAALDVRKGAASPYNSRTLALAHTRTLFRRLLLLNTLVLAIPDLASDRSLDLTILTMPAGYLYSDLTYCSLCDRYFPGDEARAQHVQLSTNHPKCDRCNRRFANRNSLRNHFVYSARHHYCAMCEREFRTAAGLRMHIEFAAVHRDDSDDEDYETDFESTDEWEDELGRSYFPEENERANDDALSGRDPYAPADEYWDEDDETDFEEEQEHYYGIAPVPPSAQSQVIHVGDAPRVTAVANMEISPDSSAPSSPRVETSELQVAHVPMVASSPRPQPILATASDAPLFGSSPEFEFQKAMPSDPGPTEARELIVSPRIGRPMFMCPLCLEAPSSFTATRCGHVFCTPCITHAVTTTVMCPVCRRPNGPRQLRTIYLPPLS